MGDVIPVGRVQVPADTGRLLDSTINALKVIPQDDPETVIDEAATAVGALRRNCRAGDGCHVAVALPSADTKQ